MAHTTLSEISGHGSIIKDIEKEGLIMIHIDNNSFKAIWLRILYYIQIVHSVSFKI